MYLKKLDIQGFKSFAPKTTLEFSPGVTAVVGPNGSGKSNFTEAIRWVMGEQSLKTLRGKKSEDIIFAGSKNKARLGMASVSMHLDNSDHAMPIDYSDVVITRKLFRNGESEYFINKNRARLLDIQELLAKTGFGQKTYSVIGQGMIDTFLKAGPKERKELFEEAAGVKQFQIKRNLSVNKLLQTKTNLSRVADLLKEIEPRLRSLKRQANKAQRKEEIEKKFDEVCDQYFNHSWNTLKDAFKINSDQLAKLAKQEKETIDLIAQLQKKLDSRNLQEDFAKKRQRQERLNELFLQKSEINEKIMEVTAKISLAKASDTNLNLTDRIKLLENEVAELETNVSEFLSEKQTLEKDLRNKIKEQSAILTKIKDCQEKLTTLKSGLISESLTLTDVQNDLEKLFKSESNLFEKINACENLNELDKLKQMIFDVHFEMEKLLLKIQKAAKKEDISIQKKLSEIQKSLSELFDERDSLTSQINSIKVSIAILDTKQNSAKQQLDPRKREIENLNKETKAKSKQETLANFEKLENEKKGLVNKILVLDKEIKNIQNELELEVKKEQEIRDQFISQENEYRAKQNSLNNIKDQVREIEVSNAQLQASKNVLIEEMHENFGIEKTNELIKIFESKPKKINNADELHVLIAKLRREKMIIGDIDPEVVKEHKEVNDRFEFLTAQKDDLEKAIISLEKIIDELDKTISSKFDTAFEKINLQFQKHFEILFNGGHARLEKYRPKVEVTDETGNKKLELSQDSYIDIKATPPGKKPRDLSLLSGGERALTSIALILAIISNNPAPFIVLDEVDASLDEANTSRYAKIIEEVAKKSQFIVVTHNRETMSCAKALYGVTMSGDGVSKLLSISLEGHC
ncbi:MAG: AAA family ATPase [Patescibacteria group bacterium]|jgi:chromosome segregation protein